MLWSHGILDLEEALGPLGDKVLVGSLHATRPLSSFVRDKLWKLSSTNLELLSGLCMLTDSILVSVLLPHCRDGDSLSETFSPKGLPRTWSTAGFQLLPIPVGSLLLLLGWDLVGEELSLAFYQNALCWLSISSNHGIIIMARMENWPSIIKSRSHIYYSWHKLQLLQ